jgi:hypothetical protein
MLRHQFRVALPEASEKQVEASAQESLGVLKSLLVPSQPGGTSAREDFEYLQSHRVTTFTIGQAMQALQIMLKSQFPNKDVGGQPVFLTLPNGNTKVTYAFDGAQKGTYEWEVSKAKNLIRPLNANAKEMIEMRKP